MFSSYAKRLLTYSDFRFILEISALSLLSRYLLVVPIAIILTLLGVELGTPNMDVYTIDRQPGELFFELVIFGPFLETWLLQWLPLKILKFARVPDTFRILITTLLFALLHLDVGLINFIGTLPIGFLLVWSYVVKEKESGRKAFWTVFAIHALTNLFPYIMYLLELFEK